MDSLLSAEATPATANTKPKMATLTAAPPPSAPVRPEAPKSPASNSYNLIRTLIEQFGTRTGLGVRYDLQALRRPIPKPCTALIVRALTQALKNVYQHASANMVDIVFEYDRGWVHGTIKDDGEGFDIRQLLRPKGLAILRQQVTAAGGKLNVDSNQGQGTTLNFSLPCESPE